MDIGGTWWHDRTKRGDDVSARGHGGRSVPGRNYPEIATSLPLLAMTVSSSVGRPCVVGMELGRKWDGSARVSSREASAMWRSGASSVAFSSRTAWSCPRSKARRHPVSFFPISAGCRLVDPIVLPARVISSGGPGDEIIRGDGSWPLLQRHQRACSIFLHLRRGGRSRAAKGAEPLVMLEHRALAGRHCWTGRRLSSNRTWAAGLALLAAHAAH